jgi:hypothetical protein
MTAKFDEDIASRFQITAEGLRTLDALLRARRAPADTLEFEVSRRDGVTYTTPDVEDIVKEQNGRETALLSVQIRLKGADLQCHLILHHAIRLRISGEDRAQVVLLTQELKNVARDQFARRRRIPAIIAFAIAGIVAILTMFVILGVADHQSRDASARLDNYITTDRQASLKTYESNKDMAQKALQRVNSALERQDYASSGDSTKAMLAAMQVSLQAQILADDRAMSPVIPFNSSSTLIERWGLVGFMGMPLGAALVTTLLIRLFNGSTSSVFLVGSEVVRNKKRETLMQNLIWIVGVGLTVAVVGGLVVARFIE